MPNWCYSELTISGDKNTRNSFSNIGNQDLENIIDFNRFIPYPKKYKDLDDKAEEYCKKNNVNVAPFEGGYSTGGYSWCIKEWGTKWNACDVEMCKTARTTVVLFNTAWSPCLPVIKAMSEKFPTLKFKLVYKDEGGGFKGKCICKGGNTLFYKEE